MIVGRAAAVYVSDGFHEAPEARQGGRTYRLKRRRDRGSGAKGVMWRARERASKKTASEGDVSAAKAQWW